MSETAPENQDLAEQVVEDNSTAQSAEAEIAMDYPKGPNGEDLSFMSPDVKIIDDPGPAPDNQDVPDDTFDAPDTATDAPATAEQVPADSVDHPEGDQANA